MGQNESMPRKSGTVKPTNKGKGKPGRPGKPVKRLEAYDTKSVDVKVTLAKMGIDTVQLDGKTTYAELVEVVKEENHNTTNEALEEIILEKTAPPPEPEDDYDDWDDEEEEYEEERPAAPPKRTRKPRTATPSGVQEVVELDAPSTLVYDTGADEHEEVRGGRGAAVYGPMNRQFAELFDTYEEPRVAQVPPVTSTQRTVSTRKSTNKLDPSAIAQATTNPNAPPAPPLPVMDGLSNGGIVPPAPAPPSSVPAPTMPRNSVPVPPPPTPVVLPPAPEATVPVEDETMEDPLIRQADGNGMEVTTQTTPAKSSGPVANGRVTLAPRQKPVPRLQSVETGPVA